MFAGYFEQADTVTLAKRLLGKQLFYQSPAGLLSGYIVETEAYLGQSDQAAHAFGGHRSAKNEALYHEAGTIYIYTIYGQFLLNLITQAVGVPQGILIRGLEPHYGLKQMQANRRRTLKSAFELTNGPGKLMKALGIQSLDLNLASFETSPLTLSLTAVKQPQTIVAAPRIGINKNKGNWESAPLRFYVAHNPYVSKMPRRQMDLTNYGWQVSLRNSDQVQS